VSRTLPMNADAMHDALLRGSALFDAGAFFEAHEAWEEQWRVEIDETRRRFLQGLIQVAAAFHKLFVAHSVDAASRLLTKGLAKLDACPTLVSTAGIEAFLDAVHAYARDLATGHVDRAGVPKLGSRTDRS
jgi:predicted metal-dependent hydrolase